jgi:hypothetical protein
MLTPEVRPVSLLSCHVSDTEGIVDRELRCLTCGCRMFSADGPRLLASGMCCSHCSGPLELIPAPQDADPERGL